MSIVDRILGEEAKTRSPVELRVNGERFDAFESGTIELSMEQGANSFTLEYVADTDAPEQRAIFEGDACELALATTAGPEVVISGYVDTAEDDDAPDALRLTASGRSRTCDLIDSSATFTPGRWSKVKIEKIALDICLPFAVDVYVVGSQGAAFEQFSVQKGEKAYDAIARAALRRGLYPYCVGGDLVLARAGATETSTVLERGVNVLRSKRVSSWAERYSNYLLRGQVRATDTNWGANASQLEATVRDPDLDRWRPLVVQAETGDRVDLATRARIECNARAGKGTRLTATVDDWETEDGKAWRPNTLVRFKNPVLGIDSKLLITTVRFAFGPDEARECELEMTRPQAFDVANYPALTRGQEWT